MVKDRNAKERNHFIGVWLMVIWTAAFNTAGTAQALPTADKSSGEAVTRIQNAREFRRALDARVKMEMHRPEFQLTTHIDDVMARFIHPGMAMSDAEALMKGAGLSRSTIDYKKSDGMVLFVLEYPPSIISRTIAVISIYPTAQIPPTVARTAAQINHSTL